MRTLHSLLALTLLAVPVRADDKVDPAKAAEQAEAIKKAVLDGDVSKLADLTHPKVVEAMGGKEKVIAASKAVLDQMKAQGIEIKSYTIGKPGDPVKDDKATYVVLPTKLELTAPKVKVQSESYLLAMTTDAGKTWTFADGTGLAAGPAREALLPTLPKDLKLPEPKPPTVTKEKE
jgi:hypothetical protein